MKKVKELHHQAMELVDQAQIATVKGQKKRADQQLRKAFEAEKQAALLAAKPPAEEPTRSVLLRSAAALGLRCREFREAERLISIALAGDPPQDVADELRDILEQVHFERHLDLRGIALTHTEVQLSLSGSDVGFGMVESEECLSRIQALEKMVYRTAERRMGEPYRETGAPRNLIRQELEIYLSAPRAASFAMTLRIGRSLRQQLLFSDEAADPSKIIDDIVSNLQQLSSGRKDEAETVRLKFKDEAYYRNFVGLARRIAPDRGVRLVGFTVVRGSETKYFALTTPRGAIPYPKGPASDDMRVRVKVSGTLLYADATKGQSGKIKLVDTATKKEHIILVPEGMMTDIVRPLWDQVVTVEGFRAKDHIHLDDIRAAPKEDDSLSETDSPPS
jgi:hypothetical protein